MEKISGVIITFNEEKNIERCVTSLQAICDEIVVIDSFSTDRTEEICKSLGVNFIQNPFAGHIEQKNYALDKASYHYVLSLDADECLDKNLQESISKVKNSFSYDCYSFNRLNNYAGKWIKHCGWYPDKKIRLFNKTKAKWGGVNPHDIITPSTDATIKHIQGDLLHYSYPTISSHITQTNKFTTIAAKAAFNDGVKSSMLKIITRSSLKFFRDFFIKKGFLDGKYGIIICTINAMSVFLKYSKIKELQEGKEI